MSLPVPYACGNCGQERSIPVSAAWPASCPRCGGTTWISPPNTSTPPIIPPADLPNVYVQKGGLGGGKVKIQ